MAWRRDLRDASVVSGYSGASLITATSSTELVAAASGYTHYITDIIITHTSNNTATFQLLVGTTVKMQWLITASTGIVGTGVINLQTPIEVTDGQAFNIKCSALSTGSASYVANCVGWKTKTT
tara:strand:+ start:3376 stop:3744 length:369 start_codon:yes stop_codon:yes gene_type:complete